LGRECLIIDRVELGRETPERLGNQRCSDSLTEVNEKIAPWQTGEGAEVSGFVRIVLLTGLTQSRN